MIDICTSYCDEFCLSFNAKKSKAVVFGPAVRDLIELQINGQPIEYVSEWGYLGTTIVGGRSFTFSSRQDLSKFFRAANSVLNVLSGAHEHTLISLLYSNCVPILTYGCGIKEYPAREMTDCNVAMNHVLRKIFGFTRWESIRYLRECFGFESLYVIFKKSQEKFLNFCVAHSNPVVRQIVSLR